MQELLLWYNYNRKHWTQLRNSAMKYVMVGLFHCTNIWLNNGVSYAGYNVNESSKYTAKCNGNAKIQCKLPVALCNTAALEVNDGIWQQDLIQ